jgi:3-methyl-2-oxobutanoate hydroxymethyltransferase
VQAKEAASAAALLDDCRALQNAGAFAIVVECIPSELAALASAEMEVPIIGIGAGAGCDGEVQVYHDLLGLAGDFMPRHARRFADIGAAVRDAVAEYAEEVRAGMFPGEEQSTHMDPRALDEVAAIRTKRVRRA